MARHGINKTKKQCKSHIQKRNGFYVKVVKKLLSLDSPQPIGENATRTGPEPHAAV